MKKVFSFVKGKKEEKKDTKPSISVEITNPSGQKIQSEDEHISGLQEGGYSLDFSGKDKALSKLHKASWFGNIEKLKLNLKKSDVNAVDWAGRTALHLAVSQGHTELAWCLINNNAVTTKQDSDGLTPFLKAVECGHKDCTNLLIECGAEIAATDKFGNNGLHVAAKNGFVNISSLLLKEGTNLNVPNNAGDFPLHLGVSYDHRELVEVLLKSGAEPDPLDREGRTPLMLAAKGGLASVVGVLLAHGASVLAQDTNGWTAEDYAQIGGHHDLVDQLKPQAKPDPVSENPTENTSEDSSDLSGDNTTSQDNEDKDTGSGEEKDSPTSACTMPPTLLPPRSWQLIQSGATQDGGDGTLRTPGDTLIPPDVLLTPTDETLPSLPTLPPPEPICTSRLSPEPPGRELSPEPNRDLAPTPERRTRSPLERAHSLDLPSDQDSPLVTPDGLGGQESMFVEISGSPVKTITATDSNENDEWNSENNNNITLDKLDNVIKPMEFGANIHEATPPGVNNYYMTYGELHDDNVASNKFVIDEERNYTMEYSHSYDNLDEKSFGTDNAFTGVSSSLDNLDDIEEKTMSIEIIQSTGKLDDTLAVCTFQKCKFRESHSLELLEDQYDSKSHKNKRHSRNKSITLQGQPQIWRSADVIPKSSSFEKCSNIDAQLECYDEALRQLAKADIRKQKKEEYCSKSSQTDLTEVEPSRPVFPQVEDIQPISLDFPPEALENEPDSLENERSFPPPPTYFMEGEDTEIVHINTVECLENPGLPMPLTILTPIKENHLESDSLSNAEISESSTLEQNREHFEVDVIVDTKSAATSPSSTDVDTKHAFYDDSDDVFLQDETLPDHYRKYFVDVRALQIHPDRIDFTKVLIPDDESPVSETPREVNNSPADPQRTPTNRRPEFEIGGVCRAGRLLRERAEERRRKETEEEAEEEEEDSEEDPPFWQSTERGGFFVRQNTVVVLNTPGSAEGNPSMPGPSQSLRGLATPGGSEAETASASDTPKRSPKATGPYQSYLKEATAERGKLEEKAACLLGAAERLKYQLEDSRQAEAAREDTIAALQVQLARLECRYAQAQEEICTLRQRAVSAEQELQHLRDICLNLSRDKSETYKELDVYFENHGTKKRGDGEDINALRNSSMGDIHLMLKHLEEEKKLEEEKNRRLVEHLEEVLVTNQRMITEREALIAQNIADVRKLQEDTICWKERYEESAAKLEMMDKKQDPRLLEAQDTIATLKRTIAVLQQEKVAQSKLYDVSTSISPRKQFLTATETEIMAEKERLSYNESTLHYLQNELKACYQLIEAYEMDQTPIECIKFDDIKVGDFQQKLQAEINKREIIGNQLKRILEELQERLEIGEEVDRVQRRLEKEFATRREVAEMRGQQAEALERVKREVMAEAEGKLSQRLQEINALIQSQIQEQARLERIRTHSESSMKQEFENISNTLQIELGKIQTALKAKEQNEQMLRRKCEEMEAELRKTVVLQRKLSREGEASEIKCENNEQLGAELNTPTQSSKSSLTKSCPNTIINKPLEKLLMEEKSIDTKYPEENLIRERIKKCSVSEE